ncbi:DNA adenine methylase, partial [Clostridium perfringens]
MNEFVINNRRYLGSKYSLIKDIQDSIDITQIRSVADIFGGTGVVGESFASKGKKVIINDILYSNTIIYKCFFGKGYFNKNKLLDYIKRYNSLNSNEIEENYFSINFAETYFNKSNCKKIGFIREDIENELKNNNINKREYYILITSLIYAIDKIANTVGHYDAYRENKEDLNKKFELIFPHIKEYKEEIKIYREDANELV